ncbi:MAG TPA: lycopene cyclase family protein [Actinomycetales bacterium]|nr:lycopene cyclase family protein [Actinomycetales bacterium]
MTDRTDPSTVDVDLAMVGVGGAGLTVLHELALAARRLGPSTGRRWTVALCDDVDRLSQRPDDRTWCFWDRFDDPVDHHSLQRNPAKEALTASWRHLAVLSPTARLELDLHPLRYAMLRAPDYYALVAADVERATPWLETVRLGAATAVGDGADAASVRTVRGDVLARWVFDSRPAPPRSRAVTTLLQHFRGAVVRADPEDLPRLPLLMDFRTPQPERGLSFGYCLPFAADRALVEYTEFSPAVLDDAAYAAALAGYLDLALDGAGHDVEHVEQGVIPMSDAPYPRRAGRRVMRIGTAGGATRASTGYTFRAMQRQAATMVEALVNDRVPVPPAPYPARHRFMDGVLLRALDAHHVSGPDFFVRLFARNPTVRVMDFLDGATHLPADLALMASAPPGAMLRSALEFGMRFGVGRTRPSRGGER